MSIEQGAVRTLQEQELDPYWVALFEQALAELRGLGTPGERMLQWFVREFWYGRVQDWVDAVGADASQVCARAVGAAHALEARRNRHERLPDWRAFTWGEMLDWVADAVASRVEDDNKASPVWRERNVVYRFDDAADAKLSEANVRGQLEKAHAKQKAAEDNAAASQSRCAEAEREVLRARGELEELREQLDRVQAEADALNGLNTRIETAKHAGDLFS